MVSWKKKRLEDQNVEAFIRQYGSHAPKQYRYSDINKMTNAFKEKLGEGGYGTVYKGKLSDGCLVAVKILSDTKGNSEEFINEVASICRTSHVNVVALLGFCFERNRRALVYEFVAKGSLDKFIYNGESLEWKTLYQIAVGIARGLEYLHRGCSTRIVHFDIKPQNILLDEDFCPKISDFGLSKLCQRKQSIISMLGARGTAGYIAPEVFSRAFGGVSHKSDVYSYGMLVLEITGARENPGVVQTSEVYFPQWIYEHLEHGKDLRLVRVTTREEEEIARKMILVGLWCIQTHPSDRPSIGKVLEMLEGSVESLQIPPKPSILSPIRLQTSACDSLSSTMDLEVAMSASNPLSFQIPSKPLLFSTARSGKREHHINVGYEWNCQIHCIGSVLQNIWQSLSHKSDVYREDELAARKMILGSLWCIQTTSSDRPPMSKVLEMCKASLDESWQIPPSLSCILLRGLTQ